MPVNKREEWKRHSVIGELRDFGGSISITGVGIATGRRGVIALRVQGICRENGDFR